MKAVYFILYYLYLSILSLSHITLNYELTCSMGQCDFRIMT